MPAYLRPATSIHHTVWYAGAHKSYCKSCRILNFVTYAASTPTRLCVLCLCTPLEYRCTQGSGFWSNLCRRRDVRMSSFASTSLICSVELWWPKCPPALSVVALHSKVRPLRFECDALCIIEMLRKKCLFWKTIFLQFLSRQ